MPDRILAMLQWNPTTERVSVNVGGQVQEFDAVSSQKLHSLFDTARDLLDPRNRHMRAVANEIIQPPGDEEG